MVIPIANNYLNATSYIARLAVIFLSTVLFISSAHAELTASVDRNPVAMNESFTLTLESNESIDGEPDFSVLKYDFEIVSQQQSSRMQMINGNTSHSIQWNVTLLPKHSGVIGIPAIKINQQQSQPLRLTVTKTSSTSVSSKDQDLFIKIDTSPNQVYVQQQLLFTISLFYAENSGMNLAQGGSLTEPELETGDAVIKKLGDDSNFKTIRNGRAFQVIQRRYAVFPQQSGKITFKPVNFEGRIIQQSSNPFGMFDPFRQNTRIKRIQSESVSLDIKPVPPQFTGKTWLPANSLQLAEDWPGVNKSWYAGEPLTRTLALIADGLTSAQLPAINASIPGEIKQYPDQPFLKDTPSSSGFSGVRQNKIALIPSHAGSFTFPEIRVPWWNTKTDKQEIAVLPARTITILPAKNSSANPANLSQLPLTTPQPVTLPQTSDANKQVNKTVTTTGQPVTSSSWWPWISLLLACGWLLTLLYTWKQSAATKKQNQPAMTTSNSTAALKKSVRKACDDNNAEQARQALLEWAAHTWPDHKPVSLGAIAERVDKNLKIQLDTLNRSLYAKEKQDWKGAELWQAFNNYRPVKTKENSATILSPLYPAG